MKAFELTELTNQQAADKQPYLEFIRERSLSVGLYVLPAGSVDKQQPHQEDEVYYVISGAADITVANETRPVCAGSIVYVGAGVAHHFHNISEELQVIVFFAPAESMALDDFG